MAERDERLATRACLSCLHRSARRRSTACRRTRVGGRCVGRAIAGAYRGGPSLSARLEVAETLDDPTLVLSVTIKLGELLHGAGDPQARELLMCVAATARWSATDPHSPRFPGRLSVTERRDEPVVTRSSSASSRTPLPPWGRPGRPSAPARSVCCRKTSPTRTQPRRSPSLTRRSLSPKSSTIQPRSDTSSCRTRSRALRLTTTRAGNGRPPH